MNFKKIGGSLIISLAVNSIFIGAYTINNDDINASEDIKKIAINEMENNDINLNFNSYIEATEILKNMQMNNEIKIKNEINMLKDTIESPYMLLVNKENLLTKSYKPDNLVDSALVSKSNKEERLLDSEVNDKLKEMFKAAKNDGITLKGISGYRSYSTQDSIYRSKKSIYVALPGASEHQTGYAIDILSNSYNSLTVGFEDTKEFEWLSENCYKYGFILRYPEGKEEITGIPYEPWHYRYIGSSEAAKEIMTEGLTLEEYFEEVNDRLSELNKMISD